MARVNDLGGPGGGLCVGSTQYTATRFVYAKNGRTVTYAMGEKWCNADGLGCEDNGSYEVTWAKEFRYDGARQRYLERELDPTDLESGTITALSKTVTDYDGDQPYLSWVQPSGGSPAYTGYELGIARIDDPNGTPSTAYYHTDMLGTTRFLTDETGAAVGSAAYTAFGELVTGTSDRFGYVGAHGYQTHDEMPYQHVGARYYDPTSGRFLQRDPIGIRGGVNVFEYVESLSTARIDPNGLSGLKPIGSMTFRRGGSRVMAGALRNPRTWSVGLRLAGRTSFGVLGGYGSACFAAFTVGYGAGTYIASRRIKQKTVAQWVGEGAANACTWCFNW